jgi:hypothetical protein
MEELIYKQKQLANLENSGASVNPLPFDAVNFEVVYH